MHRLPSTNHPKSRPWTRKRCLDLRVSTASVLTDLYSFHRQALLTRHKNTSHVNLCQRNLHFHQLCARVVEQLPSKPCDAQDPKQRHQMRAEKKAGLANFPCGRLARIDLSSLSGRHVHVSWITQAWPSADPHSLNRVPPKPTICFAGPCRPISSTCLHGSLPMPHARNKTDAPWYLQFLIPSPWALQDQTPQALSVFYPYQCRKASCKLQSIFMPQNFRFLNQQQMLQKLQKWDKMEWMDPWNWHKTLSCLQQQTEAHRRKAMGPSSDRRVTWQPSSCSLFDVSL